MKQKEKKLSPQQVLFCNLYTRDRECFGNATKSYVRAYEIPAQQLSSARKCASRLLTNVDIQKAITNLLKQALDNEVVDLELIKLIIQDQDLNAKVAAIREYNKVRSRTSDRLEGRVEFVWGGP